MRLSEKGNNININLNNLVNNEYKPPSFILKVD